MPKAMLRWLSFATMFWIVISTGSSQDTFEVTENAADKRRASSPRGYYGGLGYPYFFGEPLTILAGLAFLAYIIQVFHALYFHHHGLGGGLLGGGALGGGALGGGLLPSKGRNLVNRDEDEERLLTAQTEMYLNMRRR